MNEYQAEFWEQRYKDSNTGWDLKEVSPPLKSYFEKLEDKSLRILIPGCGNAYEAAYLHTLGFKSVTLIDISSTLVKSLRKKFKGQTIQVIHGNFFEHTGSYDLIVEQTFFCAIHPDLRTSYLKKCKELLSPAGKLAGLLFDKTFDEAGPPYGGNKSEYMALFSRYFKILKMERCQESVTPRLGFELFFECVAQSDY